jgi:hypothetical protein
MDLEVAEALESLLRYTVTGAFLAGQLAVVRFRRAPLTVRRIARPAWDATWFVPAYIWSIESLLHLSEVLIPSDSFPDSWGVGASIHLGFVRFGLGTRYCFGFPVSVFGTRALVSALIGVFVVSACLLCERVARRRGRSVREAPWTLPAGVVAALIGVAITWAVHLLAFVPLLNTSAMLLLQD